MVNLSRLLRGPSFMVGFALAVCSGCRNEGQGGQASADAALDGQPDGDMQSDPPARPGPTDLAIAVVAGSEQVGIGGSVTYAITVTNLGSQMSADITVLDTVASGSAVSTAHGEGWSCSVAAQTVTCRRSGLGAGAASTIMLEAKMPTSVGPAANEASVSAALSDPVPDNNTASCSTNVVAAADLSLTQTASADTVAFGANLTYTISVRNAGPSTAAAVSVVQTLDDELSFLNASGAGWSCAPSGQVVTCALASLATGSTAPAISIVATMKTVPLDRLHILTTTATASSSVLDPSANSHISYTNVEYHADLSVAITHTAGSVHVTTSTACSPDNCVTYTIKATNLGPATSTSIHTVIDLPTFGTFVDAAYSGGTCTQQQGALDCVQGTMATGDTATISVRWLAPSSGSAPLDLEAQVFSASSADPNSQNDDVTDRVEVVP
jgi:uncharacterized repeat protein (TIGR01451 family)